MWGTTSAVLFCCLVLVRGNDCGLNDCNIQLSYYYQEMGCTPVTPDGSCCPTHFDCSASIAVQGLDQCSFRGQRYEVGSMLNDDDVSAQCLVQCRCMSQPQNRTKFECAHVDCPEFLGYDGPLEDGCVNTYSSLNSCCFGGTQCRREKEKVSSCEVGGKSYLIGEKFYPNDCTVCRCQKGYDDNLNPALCTDVSCGLQMFDLDLIQDGCAPIYYASRKCCPIDWRCPSANDTVVRVSPEDEAAQTGENYCQFGSLRLNVGDKLSDASSSCITCTCLTPPQLTCSQAPYTECSSRSRR